MSTTLRRGGRVERPTLPEGRVEIQPPPELQPHEGIGGALMMALPMLASVGSIVFVASSGGGARGFIAAGMFLLATLGFVAVNVERQIKQRKTKVTGSRREYLQYLSTVRANVRAAAEAQREGLTWIHPAPRVLASFAEEGSRVWERTADDPNRLHTRYGTSTQPLALELVPPETAPIDQVDPVCASALHRLLSVHRAQPALPAAIDLGAFSRIEITGGVERVRALARAMVSEAAAFHSPEQLVVAVLSDDDGLVAWDWVKWLPHAHSTRESDAVGPSRMVSRSVDDLAALLPRELVDRPRFGAERPVDGPHVLLVVDGVSLPPGNHLVPEEGVHGMTVLDLPERWDELEDPTRLRLELTDADAESVGVTALRRHEEPVKGIADQLDLPSAEAFARRLAPLGAVEGPAGEDAMAGVPDLTDLLGLGDVRSLVVQDAWRTRPIRDQLRVPIGVGPNGAPVYLDIKESAQQGMGPHGLVIGATGSGKSELLRTLVLGLALTHSSETLNMVLVDFKGGATFAGLSDLPHVSAVITNLEDELTLVDRMQDALSGEMVRRQEVLRRAGNYSSARDYEKARAAGEDLEPMPSLFIVVDEFSEMLSAKPDFIDLFVAIGRLGRSLGLHLLLASQRLEEGRLRGLESHLSYRVGLRTFSAAESRTVLGVSDAYELPSIPGLGYLKSDQATMTRFKAAYVSGPPPHRSGSAVASSSQARSILPFTTGHILPPVELEPEPDEVVALPVTQSTASVLDIAVDTMVGQGPQAHQVWLPPLDVPDTLDVLMPDLSETDDSGLLSSRWSLHGGLKIPIGTVDRPREQRRDVLTVDMSGAGGHLAVVGGPRSGKSTVLRTVVSSIALSSSPRDSQIYVLDFGGGTFASMADLPHVSGVGTRSEPDVVRRIFAEVTGIADRREAYLRSQGIDSVETYRVRRREGSVDDGYGDVYLVIDGWSTLRNDFDMLEMEMQNLAQRGLTYGIHVIASAARWGDFRAAMRDVFGTRLELRLGDPTDSEIDRKIAQLVPTGRPGRGLVASKLHFLSALPRLDGKTDGATVGPAVEDLVARVRASWSGQGGPKLRLLPSRIDLDRVRELATVDPSDRRVLIGIDERDLAPVGLDVDSEPHLVVYGDGRSGKSALLRAYAREVMRSRTPAQAQIVVVDYRRSMLGELPDEYQMEYVSSAAQIDAVIGGLADFLTSRLPGADVTPDQLRNRSWWSGPEAFVLVDDYDLVSPQNQSPLAPLVPLLAQGRDVGLHVVVARRAGGASRASYDTVLQTMRDLAQPGLLLSGSPAEGALVGNTTARPAEPGRGQLVTRDRGVEVVQVAWAPEGT